MWLNTNAWTFSHLRLPDIAEVYKCRELHNSTVSQVPKGAQAKFLRPLVVQTSPDYAQKITHNSEKYGCKDVKESNGERDFT